MIITFTDLTDNRCYAGYNITLRCETDTAGGLSISTPKELIIARPDCNLAVSSPRYAIGTCTQNEHVELVIMQSNYTTDAGSWICAYDGGVQKEYLSVSTGQFAQLL